MLRRILLWLPAGLLFLLSGCGVSGTFYTITATPSATRPPTRAVDPSATPTVVIVVPAGVTDSPGPQNSSLTPTPTPTEEGDFTITGTYESAKELTGATHITFEHYTQHLVVTFLLHSAPGQTLEGTAQATFSEEGTDQWNDADAHESCTTAWNTGPVAWTAPVSGQYEKLADGRLSVHFRSTTGGPPYKRNNCIGSEVRVDDELTPDVAVGGTLVNRVFDRQEDSHPECADGTCRWNIHTVTHIEQH